MDPRLNPHMASAQPPTTPPVAPPAPAAPLAHSTSTSPVAATPPPTQPATVHKIPVSALNPEHPAPVAAAPASVHPATNPALPRPAPAAPVPPVANPISAQMVDAFPVHEQGQAPAAPSQAGTTTIQMPDKTQQPEDDLDRILQAVNNKVSSPNPTAAKTKLKDKIAAPAVLTKAAGKIKPKVSGKKPIGIMALAGIVFAALAFTAFYSYHQGAKSKVAFQPGKVGTSYASSAAIQSAGGLLVRPSDLDDLSQAFQTKMNSLNDSQDFNQQPISDQMLGL
jgi:hypothetical protein